MTRESKAFIRGLAVGLSLQKTTILDISRRLNVTRQSVYRWIEEYNTRGKMASQKPKGRSKKTSDRSNRLLVRLAKQHNFSSATHLRRLSGLQLISIGTIYRRLKAAGLRKRRVAVCPVLTRAHMAARLDWAMRRVTWRDAWNHVLFTDESRFCRFGNDGRILVWRTRGTRYDRKNLRLNVQGQGGSVHVWGAIWKGGRSQLHVLRHAVNHQRYIQVIDLFFANEILPPNFIYQQDNAPAHRAAPVIQFFADRGIRTIPWPSRSPDLNPIEHVWDYIGRKVNSREAVAENLQQLEAWILDEWNHIPQDFIDNLIDSLPRRTAAVISANGGHTRY